MWYYIIEVCLQFISYQVVLSFIEVKWGVVNVYVIKYFSTVPVFFALSQENFMEASLRSS